MAKLLIITSGIISIVNANLAMAKRLTADGHDVVYACDADIREPIESAGLHFFSLDPPVQTNASSGGRGRAGRWFFRWRSRPATWTRNELDTRFGLTRFDHVIASVQPDLVLIDAELHRYVIASVGQRLVGQRINTALTTTFVSPWRRPGVPPLHVDVPPGRAADIAWLKYSL